MKTRRKEKRLDKFRLDYYGNRDCIMENDEQLDMVFIYNWRDNQPWRPRPVFFGDRVGIFKSRFLDRTTTEYKHR